jgi:hypothetical protein
MHMRSFVMKKVIRLLMKVGCSSRIRNPDFHDSDIRVTNIYYIGKNNAYFSIITPGITHNLDICDPDISRN